MKQVKVKNSFFSKCKKYGTDSELLYNENGRPCVLILKLRYKERFHKFVVPMRSNISPTTPPEQFFKLPPNANTKKSHYHGIHYIKLFPITDKFIEAYRIDSKYDILVKNIIDASENEIIQNCQKYLYECENGNKHFMTPDIDGILSWLYL